MIEDFLTRLKKLPEFDQNLDISPYAGMMGFRLMRRDGRLTTIMKYHGDLVGSPFPPTLHGGTVASLMEMAALMELVWHIDISGGHKAMPRAIDITIDYLRAGKPVDSFARASIFRRGRRFATVHTEAWQTDPEKPIAAAMLHFQLTD